MLLACLLSLIEGSSYNPSLGQFASHGHVKRCADRSVFGREICETDVFLQGYRGRSTGDMTYLAAMDEHRLMISRYIFPQHLKPH